MNISLMNAIAAGYAGKEITLYLKSGTILSGTVSMTSPDVVVIKAGPTKITVDQECICAVGVQGD